MDLAEKIKSAFRAFPGLEQARVIKVENVGTRVLVHLTSPTFARTTSLQRQRLIHRALHAPSSPLTPEEQHLVGLVRTYTPAVFKAILKARKKRRLKANNGAAPKNGAAE